VPAACETSGYFLVFAGRDDLGGLRGFDRRSGAIEGLADESAGVPSVSSVLIWARSRDSANFRSSAMARLAAVASPLAISL
jgi:hypothetical protein